MIFLSKLQIIYPYDKNNSKRSNIHTKHKQKTNIDNIDVVVRNFIKAYYSKNELFGLRSYDLKYFKDIIYCINHAKLKTKKV